MRAALAPLLALAAACTPSPPPAAPEASAPAAAAEPAKQAEPDREQLRQSALDVCASFGKLARTIMEARQFGAPMREVMATIIEGEESRVTEQIIIRAYDVPRYTTTQYQEREIVDFENLVYADCLKAKLPR